MITGHIGRSAAHIKTNYRLKILLFFNASLVSLIFNWGNGISNNSTCRPRQNSLWTWKLINMSKTTIWLHEENLNSFKQLLIKALFKSLNISVDYKIIKIKILLWGFRYASTQQVYPRLTNFILCIIWCERDIYEKPIFFAISPIFNSFSGHANECIRTTAILSNPFSVCSFYRSL